MKLFLVLILSCLLCCTFLPAQTDQEKTTLIKIGDQLPDFSVKTLEGKTIASSEYKGKVLLINFWATWCPPCKKEMPFLQKDVFERFQKDAFAMIAISRGEEEKVVKEFIAATGYTFPIGLDLDKTIYQLFATQFIPRSFVVGKDGLVKMATVGYEEKEFAAMIELIKGELEK